MNSMQAIKIMIESRIAAEEDFPLDMQIATIGKLVDDRETALKRRGIATDEIERRQLPYRAILRTLSQLQSAADFLKREPPELLPHIIQRERKIGEEIFRDRLNRELFP